MNGHSLPEKHLAPTNYKGLISLILLLVLVLSSCNLSTTENPSTQTVYQDIQTSVAETVTSLPTYTASPTNTLLPTATVVPTNTPFEITASPTTASYSYTYYTCGNSEFIEDITIEDKTVLEPGEDFTKTWKFENTGNCTWTDDFYIVFVSGNDMDGSDTSIDQTVYVGKKGKVSVDLTAPDDEGTYTGYWQLEDAYGYKFGDIVHVKIVVEEADATSTPTATATATNTSIPTSTQTPTTTVVPTYTATSVATVTSSPTLTPTPVTTSETSVPTNTTLPTSTPEPDTATETPVITSTSIPVATSTSAPTSIPTTASTPIPTNTPVTTATEP